MVLNYSLTKSISEVYLHLSDMQKFASLHPVVYKVDILGESEYLFYERIKLGFIPYNFKYKVSLKNRVPNQAVEMDSQVQKGVYLVMKFSLTSRNDKTEVKETILISANFITKIIFQNIRVYTD